MVQHITETKQPECVYKADRQKFGRHVMVDGDPLDWRTDLVNHSPNGFEWGYCGSGPAQLALAIVAHATDDETAWKHYQDFKRLVVSRLPRAGWILPVGTVRTVVKLLGHAEREQHSDDVLQRLVDSVRNGDLRSGSTIVAQMSAIPSEMRTGTTATTGTTGPEDG